VNLDPDSLRREINEALEEIEQLEADVMELFAEFGGQNAVKQIEAYKRAQERISPLSGSAESAGTRATPRIPQNDENR
jgi:hypothetical protein